MASKKRSLKSVIACPICGAELTLTSHPTRPGRTQGSCSCSPTRAFIEFDTPLELKEVAPVEDEDTKEIATVNIRLEK